MDMAGAPTDRIPPHTAILPVLGVAAWLAIGKTGLEPLALVLVAALLGNVIAAVHHAEVVAIKVGEPFGALILRPRGHHHRGGHDHLAHAGR